VDTREETRSELRRGGEGRITEVSGWEGDNFRGGVILKTEVELWGGETGREGGSLI